MGLLAVRLAAILVGSLALWRLFGVGLPSRSRAGVLLLAATIALPLLQLVPLPPDVWTRLPGRTAAAESLRLAGVPAPWLPISLAPEATWRSVLGLLAPAAMFCAVLGLNAEARRSVVWTLPPIALLGVVLGILQLSGGQDSPLRLYAVTNADSAVGFFANRNHQAMMLVASIPFAIVLGAARARARNGPSAFWLAATGAVVVVLLVGAAATRSRAGVLLAALATFGSIAIVAFKGRSPAQSRWAAAGPALASLAAAGLSLGLVLAFSFTPLASRFQSALSEDLRAQIAPKTLELAAQYGPVGSGIGSFRAIYRTAERPEDVREAYINNAHNDFLELWLETGWAGAALIILFIAWVAAAASRALRSRSDESALCLAGALVVALLLAHSLVDYPLRTPALATLFALACGLTAPAMGPRQRENTSGAPAAVRA